jgi:hypothetical protein
MKGKVRDTLREVTNQEEKPQGLGSEIACSFARVGVDSDIPELRGFDIEMPFFG